MNPKPLSALNHLTVPSATFSPCLEPHRGAGWRTGAASRTLAYVRERYPGEAKTPAVTSAGVQERTQYVRGNYDCNGFMLSALRISGNRHRRRCPLICDSVPNSTYR